MQRQFKDKFINFFYRHRLLDGYIGILGFIVWYKLLAVYFQSLYIFDLTCNKIGGVSLEYHIPSPFGIKFPLFTFRIRFFKWKFDTADKANAEAHASYDKYRAESLAKEIADKELQAEKDKLWDEHLWGKEKKEVT